MSYRSHSLPPKKIRSNILFRTVMDAREVMIVITGAHKSLALAKCVEEGVNHMWTVSAIQMHPKGLIVCDEDATLELHVKVIINGIIYIYIAVQIV